MDIRQYLKDNIIYLDGGMGTLLQKSGLELGQLPERWNVTHPEVIEKIHLDYFNSGSNIVNTNTFGANSLKFSEEELETVIKGAVECAKRAREKAGGKTNRWIALDIGPTGKMLSPYGDLDFEDAVGIFKKTVTLGVKYGVDLVMIETMNDGYETKAAVLAVKESCDLPIFVSNAYGEDCKLMTGTTPEATVAVLEGLGVDALGINCSFGPKKLAPIVEEYLKYSSTPIIVKPNAGLPKVVDGMTVYDVDEEEFSNDLKKLVEKGARVVGGCCGTTPKYIEALVRKTEGIEPTKIVEKDYTVVSSYSHAVRFEETPIIIGERINPTGKKRLKEALKEGDVDYLLREGISQQERGAMILDVNVGLPEIDEVKMLDRVVGELQSVVDLPLQIDTSNYTAMEIALRHYNGKAMINSVNGKKESMDKIFPLVKKYGGVVVCLTLDEEGIPTDAKGRVEIAKKILECARSYGIDKKDLVFDTLALTISADDRAGVETLEALSVIKKELSCHTSLGVSNVSFGLPDRETVNANFFTMALMSGLSAGIINPLSDSMMKAYHAYLALSGCDQNCSKYVGFINDLPEQTVQIKEVRKTENKTLGSDLQNAIAKGLKEQSQILTRELLQAKKPLDIVNEEIIPALDTVGVGFENKTVYLPQLLMSAECANIAFCEIKKEMKEGCATRCSVVLATVEGDIHDIGKNIVKLLLENYGFKVYDLGRDVKSEEIVEKVIQTKAPLVGLSALMTTTVPSMETAIKLLREKAPWCKVVVGGAVLNEDYAKAIGADRYAKDALETVRYAEEIDG